MAIFIPPNGFTGAAQQTPAVRQHLATHTSKTKGHTTSVRRKRPKKKSGSRAVGRVRAKKGAVILTAGSAAAKAWGAKMKRLRKAKTKAA